MLSENSYQIKKYLVNINNTNHRKIVAKLRTASTHMKCGTLSNDKNRVNNVCDMCESGVRENLEHVLLHCKKHKIIRDELVKLWKIDRNLKTDNFMLKFILKFDESNSMFHGKILNYVKEICNQRGLTY